MSCWCPVEASFLLILCSVSGKISKRLVTGVKSGAMTGVNLKQLLSALSQVKANGKV